MSKEVKCTREGKRLCKFLIELKWSILNRNVERNEEGEWIYVERKGDSVIDYVLGNEETREKVEGLYVEGRVDSDHHPVTVRVKGGHKERRKGNGIKRGKRGV